MSLGQIALLGLISSRAAALGESNPYIAEDVYDSIVTGGAQIPGSVIDLLLFVDQAIVARLDHL